MRRSTVLPPGPVHLVGIGGYGMRGLARLFHETGRRVTGTDASEGPALVSLRSEGIACWAGHRDVRLPDDAGCVVYSAAVPENSPELRRARSRGCTCFKYAEALGRFCAERTVLACAGTHGKSTSTALLAWLLRRSGIRAGYVVGADPAPGMDEFTGNAAAGEPMVVEACEYDRSFLQLEPAAALITNVEWEHVDCFPTERLLHDAFRSFVERIRPGGLLVIPEGLAASVASTRSRDVRIVTFSGRDRTAGSAQWRPVRVVREAAATTVEIEARNGSRFRARSFLAGDHNVANVMGALAVAGELYGVDVCAAAAEELTAFRGLRRRFEVLRASGPVLVDDYAHHPTEIEAVIAAARERFPAARRIVVVFQPHQRQRLAALEAGFLRALCRADRVLVTPVFAAREGGDANGAASASFAGRLAQARTAVSFCPDFENAREELLGDLDPGDVVLFLGAGDITDFAGGVALAVARSEDTHG